MCVRKKDGLIILNMECDNCTFSQILEIYQKSEILPEVVVKLNGF